MKKIKNQKFILVDGNWDDQVTLPGDDESKDRVRLVIEQSTRLSDILYD